MIEIAYIPLPLHNLSNMVENKDERYVRMGCRLL